MRILAALVLLLCLTPGDAGAGPWPREMGTWFVSSDIRFAWSHDPALRDGWRPGSADYAVYAEYGLPRDLTLGLDLGHTGSVTARSILFLRIPLRDSDSGLKLSADIGLGKIDDRTVLRPGLSFGKGFEAFGTSGWFTVDTQTELSPDVSPDIKLDLSYGINLDGGTKLILQLQSGKPGDADSFARLAPSLVVPLGGNRHLDLGLLYGVTGDDSFGVKFGIWQTF